MSSLQERTRLSRALNDIDIRIHANLGSDEILQQALDGFVETLGADAGDIKLLLDGEWLVAYQHGFGQQVVGAHLSLRDAPVAVEVARREEPVIVTDLLAQEELPYVGFPCDHNLRAVIAFPLVARGEVAGGLFAWMREPRTFSEGELDFARRMAASLALALENSRLYEAEQSARRRAEDAEHRLEQELERTRILLKTSDDLSSGTEPNELLERLGRNVLEATGIGRVFINLIDTSQQVLIPKVATGGLVTPEGARIPLSRLSRTSLDAIIAKRTAILDYERPDVPEYDRKVAQANKARLVLFVPLVHVDDVIGHITLDQPDERYEFTAEQIRIVESIASQASIALQNAQLFEREHRIAETLQQALLVSPERIDAVDVSFLYRPALAARVGGDFYDVVELDSEHVALIVGDVSGKGIRAARLTALMRDGARAYLLETNDPAECFARLNILAHRFTPSDKFATAFLGVLNRSTGRLRYCNAAHPTPAVIGNDGVRLLDSEPAGLLGAFPDTKFASAETVLALGETLVMVTDGVTEARNEERFLGEEGLLEALCRLRGVPVDQLPQAVIDEVVHFSDGRLRDDVVVLCAARRN